MRAITKFSMMQLGSLAKKKGKKTKPMTDNAYRKAMIAIDGNCFIKLTKNNKERLKWIEQNLYEGWGSKSYKKQLNKIMNEALYLLYSDMLDKHNQGEDHEGIVPEKQTKRIGGCEI